MNDPMSCHQLSQYRTYTRVLMRIPIVLLPPQRAGLDVRQTGHIASPFGLDCHLEEFGVLLDHGLDDAEEAVLVSVKSQEGERDIRLV